MCHQNNYDNCCRCIVVKKVCEQVSKNIFNKNDNNVGLLRTVKKYGYKKNTANNKIGMGLVMSHIYNLSHVYLSHTPHCKAPYISGLIYWPIVHCAGNSNVRQAVIA